MIIDIHTHAFPEKIAAAALSSMQNGCHSALFSDGTVKGLIQSESNAHVDLAILQPVATNPDKVSRLNDAALDTNRAYGGKGVFSFGAMHPLCPYWDKELERIRAEGLVGVKLHPPYAGVDIDDPHYIAVLRKCRDLSLIVLMHSGRDIGLKQAEEALPDKLRRALDQVGPMKLIAAHMGSWDRWEEGTRLLPETGIYIDTAFSLGDITPANDGYEWTDTERHMLSEDAFMALVDSYGPDHVLFGTDSPWADPADEIRHIKALPLPEHEIDMILGGNAEKLLLSSGLDIPSAIA